MCYSFIVVCLRYNVVYCNKVVSDLCSGWFLHNVRVDVVQKFSLNRMKHRIQNGNTALLHWRKNLRIGFLSCN